jgi:RNA polymerase primary sigma factor
MPRQQTALETPKSELLDLARASHRALNDNSQEAAGVEPAARRSPESLLAPYFKEMAPVPLLGVDQEREAARKIGSLERLLWAHILRRPALLEWALRAVDGGEALRLDIAKLRRAARRAGRDAASRRRHERRCERAARRIHAKDVDTCLLRGVCAELQRLFRREARGWALRGEGPPGLRGRGLSDHYGDVLALSMAVQRVRDEFVRSNLRLVVSFARRFDRGALPLSDLIQEGNLGLMKAVERFDYRRGYRFSTYASWWIRHSINRALANHGRTVRLPVHALDDCRRVSRAKQELSSRLGRTPTLEEIGLAANLSLEKVARAQESLAGQPLSLDRAVSDEDDRSFVDLLADPHVASPAEKIMAESVSERVQQLLGDLKPIEADVLRKRYGLAGGAVLTLREIGDSYQLSRERIRQIQERALDKIRRALKQRHVI